MNCKAAAEYSRAHFGHSVLVFHDGEVRFEQYEPPFTSEVPIHMASATKSFWGIAAAAMVQDGQLEFDEPAHRTLDEWKHDTEDRLRAETRKEVRRPGITNFTDHEFIQSLLTA